MMQMDSGAACPRKTSCTNFSDTTANTSLAHRIVLSATQPRLHSGGVLGNRNEIRCAGPFKPDDVLIEHTDDIPQSFKCIETQFIIGIQRYDIASPRSLECEPTCQEKTLVLLVNNR